MSVMSQLVALWERQYEFARKAKRRLFGRTASALWDYYGSSERMLSVLPEGENYPAEMDQPFPDGTSSVHTARLNKSYEFVALMMPYLFAQLPNRTVSQRVGQLPPELAQLAGQSQQLAAESAGSALMEWILNYLPGETHLSREIRAALPEALVTGMGYVWHELEETPQGILPASFFESNKRILFDADARTQNEAAFIIRVRRHPAWRLAETYGISADLLRQGRHTSRSFYQQSVSSFTDEDGENEDRPIDERGDIVEYIEIYSRVGLGFQLPAGPEGDELGSMADNPEALRNLGAAIDTVGPHIRLVIVPGVPFPINLAPDTLIGTGAIEQITEAIQWPIPFFEDRFSPWPFSDCIFYPESSNPYAISPLRGGLPIQRFLDHVYTWLMTRVRRSCRDLIVTSKELEEALQNAIEKGDDFEIVPVEGNASDVQKLIHVVEFPDVKRDIIEVLHLAERAYEQNTGMTPLLSGTTQRAMRSATEANVLQGHTTSRPDDYAQQVEDWHSRIARKDAIATRLFMSPRTVAQIFREPDPELAQQQGQSFGPFTQIFAQFVSTPDAVRANAEWAYGVEAGSARRKNQQKALDDMQQIVPLFAPHLFQVAMAGLQSGQFELIEPWNGLVETVGTALDTSLDRLKIPPVTLPPPPEGAGQ